MNLFRIQNTSGAYAEVTNYGASLVSLVVPDKHGALENIILNYPKPEDYFSDKFYLGSTVGRFANRIANAQFPLNGTVFQLDKNDGNNSNHGGFSGFHSRLFDCQEEGNRIVFTYLSKDGEGGFPGNLRLTVVYSFSEDNELRIEYKAVCDKATPFNPTNHAYFNLSAQRDNILNHELKVYADQYLETNDKFLPTGNILPLAGSAFDFREYTPFSRLMPLKKEVLPGYNTYFISHSEDELKHLASIKDTVSGRQLEVFSSMPGIQVYTGDYLSEPFYPFAGVALEAQFYPDAPNHKHFPSCILFPDKEANHTILFKCRCKN